MLGGVRVAWLALGLIAGVASQLSSIVIKEPLHQKLPSDDSVRAAGLAEVKAEDQANLQLKAKVKQTDEVAVKSVPHKDIELDTLVVEAGGTAIDEGGHAFYELDHASVEMGFEPTRAPYGLLDAKQRWECPYNKATKIVDPMYWPANQDLLVRRIVQLPPGVTKIIVKATVHKSLAIYMNGVAVSGNDESEFVEPGGLCPSLDNVVVTIPQSEIRTGANLLALHAMGGPDLNYFDIEVRSYYPRPTGRVGQTYTWGKGFYGVLGNGYEYDDFQPSMALRPKTLAGRVLKKLSMGVAHTMLLLEDGGIYGWGRNQEGQLGPLEDYTEIPVPLESVETLGYISDIVSGSLHNLVMDVDGIVYSFGENADGQCGIGLVDGELIRTILEPTRIAGVNDEIFRFIGAKDRHSVAISDIGAVFEWGKGVDAPVYVSTVNDVVQLEVGTEHALILDAAGVVHVWGSNPQGQVGIAGVDQVATPTPIDTMDGIKIVKIAVGSDNNFALSDDGKVFVWGGCAFGKNGLGVWRPQTVPLQIKYLQKHVIKRVAAGMTSSYFLTNKGEVYMAGANLRDGSHSADPQIWASASDKYFAEIYASHLHFGALTNPEVWNWAKVGDYYQGTME